MNHSLVLCYVIALMGVLVALTHIPEMPPCLSCGKRREHARDCPLKRDASRR